MLRTFNRLPPRFLDVSPQDLLELLGGPSLIHLGGATQPPIFVSILLHGNETSGLTIVQNVLKELREDLPRGLLLFVGNVFAAQRGLRKLESTADYNRIWRHEGYSECSLAQEVITRVHALGIKTAIDLHNNTGKNPVYGCIRELDANHKYLSRLFSPIAVHTQLPQETLCHRFSDFCTAITCECGMPGTPEGIERGTALLKACLSGDLQPRFGNTLKIYSSKARILVPRDSKITFSSHPYPSGFTFPTKFDQWNFTQLEIGHVFGYRGDHGSELLVLNEDRYIHSTDYLRYRGNEIIVGKPFTPAMLTLNIPIIFQDCLGYIMEEKE